MQQRDSLGYTLMVAAVLCVVCSLAVSAAAVALRPMQEANEKLDQQKNILDATGLAIGEYGNPGWRADPSTDRRTVIAGSARSWSIWKLASTPPNSTSTATT